MQLYSSAVDANSDVNNLNANGILTVFNAFGTGLRVWGNRSSAFPSNPPQPDNFISVRRTMDIIEESVELAMLQFIDQPISNALIIAIVASVNAFLRTLIQRGALVAGSASYDPTENPPAQISAGQLVFDIDVMPPPPAERLTFQTFIDVSLLQQLGQTNALTTSARPLPSNVRESYRGSRDEYPDQFSFQRQRLYRWHWPARPRRRSRNPSAATSR